jgi:hypothetical protein
MRRQKVRVCFGFVEIGEHHSTVFGEAKMGRKCTILIESSGLSRLEASTLLPNSVALEHNA